jgi:poly-gamma-glutamate capsule biosynthesis protein CapA/YwtB (metallophosphatase superfamily)
VELLRRAGAAFGNLETSILDVRALRAAPRTEDDWCLMAPPAVARDLAELGLRLLSRANNHAMDWGPEGMRETSRHLDAAELVHAGSGDVLAAARAPRYLETTGGRIGLVSLTTTPRFHGDRALDQFGEAPGRPGINALRVDRTIALPPPALQALREAARIVEPWNAGADPAAGIRNSSEDGSCYPSRRPCRSASTGMEPKSMSSRYLETTSPIAVSSRSAAAMSGASSRK